MTRVTGINGHLFLASYLTEPEVTFVVWRYSQIPSPALTTPTSALGALDSWDRTPPFEVDSQREDGAVTDAKACLLSEKQERHVCVKCESKSVLRKLVVLYRNRDRACVCCLSGQRLLHFVVGGFFLL